MNCNKCGTKNVTKAKFCKKCGSSLKEIENNQIKLKGEDAVSLVQDVASTERRFLNYVLDWVLTYPYSFGLSYFLGFSLSLIGLSSIYINFVSSIWGGIITNLLLYFSYYIIFEYYFQKSPAKFVTGTMVVTNSFSKPSFKQILGRTFCRVIPFEPFSFLGREKAGWHDTYSGTMVVIDRDRKHNDWLSNKVVLYFLVFVCLVIMVALRSYERIQTKQFVSDQIMSTMGVFNEYKLSEANLNYSAPSQLESENAGFDSETLKVMNKVVNVQKSLNNDTYLQIMFIEYVPEINEFDLDKAVNSSIGAMARKGSLLRKNIEPIQHNGFYGRDYDAQLLLESKKYTAKGKIFSYGNKLWQIVTIYRSDDKNGEENCNKFLNSISIYH